MAKKDKIDFIGIGAEKAGTTWLANKLDQHPNICISEPKEIHYFNAKSSYIHNYENINYKKGDQWYTKHFSHCKIGSLKGDFSTGYLPDKEAAKNIYNFSPKTKIIVMIRNPIDRAYSQFWMYKKYFKKENRSFEDVIKQEPEYIEKGLYYKQIQNYLRYFKREQILVILFDEIKEHPESVIKKVLKFLGEDSKLVNLNSKSSKNAAKESRFKGSEKIINISASILIKLKLTFVLQFLKRIGIKKIAMKVLTKPFKYEKMSDNARLFLRKAFKSDIRELEKLLQKNLSDWV